MEMSKNNNSASNSKTKIIIWTLITIFALSLLSSSILSFFLYEEPTYGNVAKIYIDGVITTDAAGDTVSDDIIAYIKDADADPAIKAIVFEINSPGGSAVASEEIVAAIKKVNKTTISVIREVGASGAYWLASSTNEIIANPLSITGSIGVYGSYLEFSGFLARYNVTYERLIAGEYKDMGSPMKKMTPAEKKKFDEALSSIHEYFIRSVAQGRGMNYTDVKKLATGEVYLGMDAKRLGLIDEVMSYDDVDQYLKAKLNQTQIEYAIYKHEKTIFDILGEVSANFAFNVGKGVGKGLTQESLVVRT